MSKGQGRITTIISDNEGCLVPGKGEAMPLEALQRLRVEVQNMMPVVFSLCTGRPVPYVEALGQVLGIQDSKFPFVSEGGAVLYFPYLDRMEVLAEKPQIDHVLSQLDPESYRMEPGKLVCTSLYPEGETTVDDLFEIVIGLVKKGTLTVAKSSAAVDITPKQVDKGYGVREACQRGHVSLRNVLCIGDAENDLPMLKIAGWSACPANATGAVKSECDYIASTESTEGIIEILKHFQDRMARSVST